MFLTKVKDIDLAILQKLNDKDLKSISLVSKYGQKLCEDEFFWMSRLMNILPIEEIVYLKESFSYREVYYFIKNKNKKRGILEAIKRNNFHLFTKLWDKDFHSFEEILCEIGKQGNKDIVTFIFSDEDTFEAKYDMAGTIFKTAGLEFMDWLLSTRIIQYDQYIMCVFEYKIRGPISSIITKYMSNIKEEDYINIIRNISAYVEKDNVDIAKDLLKIIFDFKHKRVKNYLLKKYLISHHESHLIDKNFIDSL